MKTVKSHTKTQPKAIFISNTKEQILMKSGLSSTNTGAGPEVALRNSHPVLTGTVTSFAGLQEEKETVRLVI